MRLVQTSIIGKYLSCANSVSAKCDLRICVSFCTSCPIKTAGISGNNNATDAQVTGTCALAVNLENLCFKSKSFTTGTNSLTSPIILNCAYPASVAIALTANTMLHFDQIFEFSEQGVPVRF